LRDVPVDPQVFIEQYLPAQVDALAASADLSSVGAVVVRVLDVGTWSLRLAAGRLEVCPGVEDDALLQITLSGADFEALVVEALRRVPDDGRPVGRRGLRALTLDPTTARGLWRLPGSVRFVVTDGDVARTVLLTPGLAPVDTGRADCEVTCRMEDYLALQVGATDPMQLFASGRLRLSGHVQLALALSGIFA
jgi:hypothetical protein